MKLSKLLLILLLFSACKGGEESGGPRPRAYPRINYPEKKYEHFDLSRCHYSFEKPVYANVVPDPYPTAEECWYNVEFVPFGATLHLSYRDIHSRKELFNYIEDSREMVFKHVNRADQIVENYISTPRFHGIFYELDGSTATNAQFYVTDSTSHFLRGSLYFNSRTSQDSIAPVLLYLKKDILRLVETLKWE